MAQITWPPSATAVTLIPWSLYGDYTPDGEYPRGAVVLYNGDTWLAEDDVPTDDPPDEAKPEWSLLIRKGADGADGADGAVGPAGVAGPQGVPGLDAIPSTWDSTLVWTDIAMENDWVADADDPPQWAMEADGTVWLRGTATDGSNSIVGHLADAQLPADRHVWGGSSDTGGTVNGMSFTLEAHGAIVARASSTTIHLSTSYKNATAVSGGSGNSGVGP